MLGPIAKAKGWAPGPIKDIETGAAGWLMWLGLALLLGDCFSELALLILNTAHDKAVQNGWVRTSSGSGSGGVLARLLAGAQHTGSSSSRAGGYQQLRFDAAGGSGSGLRSRSGSKSAVAGSNLELSPNSSTNNVPAAEALAGSPGSQQQNASGSSPVVVPIGGFDDEQQLSLLPQHQHSHQSSNHGDVQSSAASNSQLPAQQKAATPAEASAGDDTAADAHAWLLSARFWVPGLLLSTALATAVLSPMLAMPVYEPMVAVIVALLVALLAVRALGQTDLNPVSGVGKISQVSLR